MSRSYVQRHPGAVLLPLPAGHFALVDPRSAVWPTVLGALDELGSR